jgi:DNA-binding NarL/FixJ family response regulator
MEKSINILVADDHYLVAKLIRMMLISCDENYTTTIACCSTEVFDIVKNNSIDLIMLDIDMPKIDGIQVLKSLKASNPEIKIIMLSNHTEAWIIKRTLNFGANGYTSKYADSDEILKGIKAVLNGELFLCSTTLKCLYSNEQNGSENGESIHVKNVVGSLSKREIEILKLVVEEYSSKEISEILFISHRTVETHRKNILKKLGVKNSLGLIKLFVENKSIELQIGEQV